MRHVGGMTSELPDCFPFTAARDRAENKQEVRALTSPKRFTEATPTLQQPMESNGSSDTTQGERGEFTHMKETMDFISFPEGATLKQVKRGHQSLSLKYMLNSWFL